MVSLGSFFLKVLPLFELFVVRKRDAINALQALAIAIALPVGRAVLGQLERLYLASVLDMRSTAQINERTASVYSGGRRVDFLVQYSHFELIVLLNMKYFRSIRYMRVD